jgi:hypothetical protein
MRRHSRAALASRRRTYLFGDTTMAKASTPPPPAPASGDMTVGELAQHLQDPDCQKHVEDCCDQDPRCQAARGQAGAGATSGAFLTGLVLQMLPLFQEFVRDWLQRRTSPTP